jgi:hypothetical protein
VDVTGAFRGDSREEFSCRGRRRWKVLGN